MNYVNLFRMSSGDDGTFGDLYYMDKRAKTAELPWRENKAGISCIPTGSYPCKWLWSEHHKRNIYHVLGIPGRDKINEMANVEVHSGNFAGDTSLGFDSNVLGCISLGSSIGEALNKAGKMQKAVLDSKEALSQFEATMNMEPFILNVQDRIGASI